MTKTITELNFTSNKGETVSLSQFAGKAILIVNTASKCGLTPQYEGLQALHEKYKEKGLVVIGFPCDQFAHQEPGNDGEIAKFCSLNYGVDFLLASKVDVNGANTHPVFKFLKKKLQYCINFYLFADGCSATILITSCSTIKKLQQNYLEINSN